jgi:two-component system chemotaxis response regulator CheY
MSALYRKNTPMVAASTIRVMVVDDDEVMRKLMRRMLERMGFTQIYTAKDGAEGLELARSQRPDVIISDYDMPVMHGLQFLRAVREDPALSGTAFVMLSGVANKQVAEKAAELGANSSLTKPVMPDDLKRHLGALIHEFAGADPFAGNTAG